MVMKFKEAYLLDPNITFLNHGSFGAVPRTVFETYQHWQCHIERQPVAFFQREAPLLLRNARAKLGEFLNVSQNDVVFVTNTTFGINVIARSLNLGPDDSILMTNAEYGALDRTWRFLAEKQNFHIIRQPIKLPFTKPKDFVSQFLKGIRPNTRLVFFSHILSALSAILPIKEICDRCREQQILTVIDGAHAPGHIPLNLKELGADFYVGNLHKWLSAPRGSAFIYARPALQEMIEPLVISWGWQAEKPGPSKFVDWHEYLGTRGLSAFLSVPAAINFQQKNHWENIRESCHQTARYALETILVQTREKSLYQPDSHWYGQMVTIPLPKEVDPIDLHDRLWKEDRIEVVVLKWQEQPFLRVSVQAYNTKEEINKLIQALIDKF